MASGDLIHGRPNGVSEGDDMMLDAQVLAVLFRERKTSVTVPDDAFIDGDGVQCDVWSLGEDFMHQIQGDCAVFPAGQCDTKGGFISGSALFFKVFFDSPFHIVDEVVSTEMYTAVPDEGDGCFVTFKTGNGHGRPLAFRALVSGRMPSCFCSLLYHWKYVVFQGFVTSSFIENIYI
jgi:hypothetical protein